MVKAGIKSIWKDLRTCLRSLDAIVGGWQKREDRQVHSAVMVEDRAEEILFQRHQPGTI